MADSNNPINNPIQRNRGVVLLSTLLVIVLLTGLVYQLMTKHALLISQTQEALIYDQLLSFALGAETLTRQVLYQDHRSSNIPKDTLQDPWAKPLEPFFIGEGLLEIQIKDLNRCFNLNSLAGSAGKQHLKQLKNLLRSLNLPLDIGDAWYDWIDTDNIRHEQGAEDGDYLLNEKGYRTPNSLAAHVSELRLIKGISAASYELLKQHVCVYPSRSLSVNVNTASSLVLSSLDEQSNASLLAELTASPRDFDNINAFINQAKELQPARSNLRVSSEFFEMHARISIGSDYIELLSVLRKDLGTGNIEIVSRDLGKSLRSLFVKRAQSIDEFF
mgnify:CR=1 FL=1